MTFLSSNISKPNSDSKGQMLPELTGKDICVQKITQIQQNIMLRLIEVKEMVRL